VYSHWGPSKPTIENPRAGSHDRGEVKGMEVRFLRKVFSKHRMVGFFRDIIEDCVILGESSQDL